MVNSDAPPYRPELWEQRGDNCYEYAVAGNRNINDPLIANPGEAGGNTRLRFSANQPASEEELISMVQQDGLQAAGIERPPEAPKDHYVIALYRRDDGADYHFARENPDGTWSHKYGPAPVDYVRDAQGQPTQELPATLSYGSGSFSQQYQLIQYFYAPKEGVDMGLDAYIERRLADGNKEAIINLVKDLEDNGFFLTGGGEELTASLPPDGRVFTEEASKIR